MKCKHAYKIIATSFRTLTQTPACTWLPEHQGQVENPQYMVGGHPLKS